MTKPDLKNPKDYAYWERNQLVAALSKLYPAWLERHPATDESWEDDWRWIVFIVLPGKDKEWMWITKYVQGGIGRYKKKARQLSWHIHESELENFSHLELKHGNSWDGHTNEKKYERLKTIKKRLFR